MSTSVNVTSNIPAQYHRNHFISAQQLSPKTLLRMANRNRQFQSFTGSFDLHFWNIFKVNFPLTSLTPLTPLIHIEKRQEKER